jgi:hypothetical protein
MHPVLKTYAFVIQTLRYLVDGVRGELDIERPRFVKPGVARKLKAGIKLIEAYLRRVLILMALALESTLVNKQKPEKRPHGRKCFERPPRLLTFPNDDMNRHLRAELYRQRQKKQVRNQYRDKLPARQVFAVLLYKRLDMLTAIAADPMKRATRLAFQLARSHEGRIFPPNQNLRVAGPVKKLWGLEPSATFDGMGVEIITKSRSRPPPLPPRRSLGPTIWIYREPRGPWPDWLPGIQKYLW